MKKTEVQLNCKYIECKKEYILSENKRIFGEESMVYQLGYCSARCYTKSRV